MKKRLRAAAFDRGPGEIRDVRLHLAPSYSFGTRSSHELNKLASCTPFYCKTGTHRVSDGETLLDHGRRFDKKGYEGLVKAGRHWKATPGPGAYRTQRTLGEAHSDEALTSAYHEKLAVWKFGTGPQSKFVADNVGTSGQTPGPGRYKTWTQYRTMEGKGNKHLPRWSAPPESTEEMCTPNLIRSQSAVCLNRHPTEMDRLAECTPFFCKFGTHRASHGESLLDHGRRFDVEKNDKLLEQGRHWKATPGPGTYRTQKSVGVAFGDEMSMHIANERMPIWKFGTSKQSNFVKDHMGTSFKSPGAGTYKAFTQFSI